MKDWIAIFKTGTHTDSEGRTRTWTDSDLDHIVQSYDPAANEAPVVIGHPETNAPAYGWVESLKRDGGMLYMKMKDLVPAFAGMIAQKMFKKRSISLTPDGTLRHVGWLGAVPPAVKGLPDVAFGDKGGINIEFCSSSLSSLNGLNRSNGSNESVNERKEEAQMNFWERLKKRLTDANISFRDLFGSDDPPVLYTEADIQTKITAAVADAVKGKESEFAEAGRKKEEELKKREEALRSKEQKAKTDGVKDFCEGLKKKGILTPAMDKLGMGITAFMDQIAAIETPIEFGEEGKKEKQTPFEFCQAFLSALPKAIEFREVAGRDKDVAAGNAGAKIEALVREKMKTDKALPYGSAFSEVQKENPQLAAEYAEELAG